MSGVQGQGGPVKTWDFPGGLGGVGRSHPDVSDSCSLRPTAQPHLIFELLIHCLC